MPFVCQRKNVCSLEAKPPGLTSTYCLFSRYNTSLISLADSITKRCDAGSDRKRNCTNQPRLIVNDKETCLKLDKCLTMCARKPPTFGDDVVISRPRCLLIPRNIPQTIRDIPIPQDEGAKENHENPHCIEVCICDTAAKNQTPERLRRVARIAEVGVASF